MPDGFEKQVTKTQIRDLLEFLAQRGKFIPLDLRPAATITSVRGMFFEKDGTLERMIFPDWGRQNFRGASRFCWWIRRTDE